MKPEFKTFAFKAEESSDDGVIVGYASTFGNIDLGDDVVEKGAFKKTIRENKGKFPILADHDPTKQIGWNLQAEEDENGLLVRGQIDLNTQLGRERFSLAKKALEIGAKMGLSIGYVPVKAQPDKERPSVRKLQEIRLFEYSFVTFPMNTSAMLTAAKSFFESSSLTGLVEEFYQKAIASGATPEEIESALRNGAATKSNDPLDFEQSIDNLLSLLQQ